MSTRARRAAAVIVSRTYCWIRCPAIVPDDASVTRWPRVASSVATPSPIQSRAEVRDDDVAVRDGRAADARPRRGGSPARP